MLAPAEFDALVDLIYEAAVVPEIWPEVLDRIAAATGSVGAIILAEGRHGPRWRATGALLTHLPEAIATGLMAVNPRPGRALALGHSGFVHDLDLFTHAEMDADPMYGFLRARGLGWCTGVAIPTVGEDAVIFSWERAFAAGPFTPETVRALDPLRAHLARAGLIATRLGLAQARSVVSALDLLGLPAAVLSPGNRVIAANGLFAGLVPSVAQDRSDRVHLTDPRADGLLVRALAAPVQAGDPNTVASIPIAARADRGAMIAHLVPVRGAARDVFAAAATILVVADLRQGRALPAELMQGLFDLTPAEARVARGLTNGHTVGTLADVHGVSSATIRTQLKAIFAKTGTARQADLVAMLTGAAIGRDPT
ncbi:LuxR C-terminal-related transcriptional regulator [Methylobacterium sp. WL6]|uniref:helix-turn-helix transcriptional regulator n=1 Tax=Methylobacterium sp. WL6 TaxID=2603901 RepID=UPI0011C75151|nr:LuxR C-terminal-related transcriptional regulator [Methylobacterium sp. WL6]TXN63852.1 LuxR family transcriptional regulator [Methylobacterium sp. WL6]